MKTGYIGAGALWVTLAAGCTVGPDYRPPVTTAPATWHGVAAPLPATRPTGPTSRPAELVCWWTSLRDPALDDLIERALASNLDLRLATARVREARAQRGVVAADLWPQADLSASYDYAGANRNTGAKPAGDRQGAAKQAGIAAFNTAVRSLAAGQGIDPAAVARAAAGQAASTIIGNRMDGGGSVSRGSNLFQFGFDASWELDVFGGIRRSVEAADDDIAAAQEDRRGTLVTLLSEVALNYVQLRGSQRRLVIAEENIRAQQDTLDLTRTLNEAGFAADLEVAQARAQLAATQSQVPALERDIQQAIFQLSTLLAMPPTALLAELEAVRPIPPNPPEVPVGLPSDVLRQRPDIRSAERQLAAATARIGVAVADLFPRFSLTGSFGPRSRDVNHLLDGNSLAWSVGPRVNWPVFDGWRIRSNIEVQNARQKQSLVIYEQTVLNAFKEVEQALVAYTKEQVRRRSLAEAVAASQVSTDLSNELYSRGMTAFLNVLESQRALYATQDQLVQSETAVITNLIALYKTLGGGWQTPAG